MADSSISSQFEGVWKLESSENFDAYMKVIGISWAMRQVASATKPTLTIVVNGKHWSLKQESAVSTTTTEFDIDVEFEETTPDGRVCKSTFSLTPDGKLIQQQKGKIESIFTRYIQDGKLVAECEANGVKSVRKYIRIR